MAKYRKHLPQLDGGLYLTDSGLETTLIFHDNIDLPYFAAFDLLRDKGGKAILRKYYRLHAKTARTDGTGFILESPTWRASPDWGRKLGYSPEALAAINREAIELMAEVRGEFRNPGQPMVISGNLGPRGDGYDPGEIMSPEQAQIYHCEQIGVFSHTDADMITALTITNTPEAIGIVRAAKEAGMPVVIGFTVETDGKLPTGQALSEAVREVDEATDQASAYYMINCAHPSHFATKLDVAGDWIGRMRGIRANASHCSHAELDEATALDAGDPAQLATEYSDLIRRFGQINVLGGCCGTDHRHIVQISAACRETVKAAAA
ncbi:MAG: homocysteine S-methyltransferase family protein [Alphaproteobacteria bacterium]|nr:homocysteine S-methyltransferase family protein [Alphaproteobacteria bacterium]MBL6951820.1 homocysteine S-methyltransferase family protein [Alphaproteobacteria bacterium]